MIDFAELTWQNPPRFAGLHFKIRNTHDAGQVGWWIKARRSQAAADVANYGESSQACRSDIVGMAFHLGGESDQFGTVKGAISESLATCGHAQENGGRATHSPGNGHITVHAHGEARQGALPGTGTGGPQQCVRLCRKALYTI